MLELKDIHFRYEGKPLLNGIHLTVSDDETVCLLGASGSGKSTLLRIIAGIEKAERGQILWNGALINDMPVNKRNFGLMFQDYALFPHLSVFNNIAFGLTLKKMDRRELRERVEKLLEQIGMTAFAERNVAELSGGEQQRVALARTLATGPDLIMLDEPLGALDHSLRQELMRELRNQLSSRKMSALYVTHDQEEAFVMADAIALIHDGIVIQKDRPEDLCRKPVSSWVATFLGMNNMMRVSDLLTLYAKLDEIPAEMKALLLRNQAHGWALFRNCALSEAEREDARNGILLQGEVKSCYFTGYDYRCQIQLLNGVVFEVRSAEKRALHEKSQILCPSEDLWIMET